MKNLLLAAGFAFGIAVSSIVLADQPTTQYPTLTKLCQAVLAGGGTGLPLAATFSSAREIWGLDLTCAMQTSYNPPRLEMRIIAHHEIVTGATFTTEEIVGGTRVLRSTVNQVPEFDLAFVSDHVQFMVHDFLRLNDLGQPLMMTDRFDSTLDPSIIAGLGQDQNPKDFISGFYVQLDGYAAQKRCLIAAETSDEISACVKTTASSDSMPIGAKNQNSIAVYLGWLAPQYPTNLSLDASASRVDFQAALSELADFAAHSPHSDISDQDFQALLSSAKSALKAGN
jgi:hypothetical protein